MIFSVKNIIFNTAIHVFDVISPSRCIGCEKPVSFKYNNVCGNCLEKIQYAYEKCPICSGLIQNSKCVICSDRKFYIKKNIVVADYTGIIKELLHHYKFNKRQRLHKPLSYIVERYITGHDMASDIITYVPINNRKKWERGFNQSELIAKDLAKKLNIPFKHILIEKSGYNSQRDLGFNDRFFNVINRYGVINSDRVYKKKILIIDDIFTTGATLNECARILLEAGACEIRSIAIARTMF